MEKNVTITRQLLWYLTKAEVNLEDWVNGNIFEKTSKALNPKPGKEEFFKKPGCIFLHPWLLRGDMGTKLVDPFICLLLFKNSRFPKSRKNPTKNYPISSEPWTQWLTDRMGHYHSQNLTKPNWSYNEVT